jgi:hypothetical protein
MGARNVKMFNVRTVNVLTCKRVNVQRSKVNNSGTETVDSMR